MSEETVVEQGSEAEGSDRASAEKEAKLFGWNPDYDGPGKRTAEEFLEEGKRINGFLRKDLDKIKGALAGRDAEIAELRSTMKDFAAFHQETEKKAYERAVTDLKEQRRAALREGDGEKVVELEDQIDQLHEAAPQTQQAEAQKYNPATDPVWTSWVVENQWFTADPKRRAITNGYGDLLRQESPSLVGRAFLEEVKARVQEDFPQWFKNTERERAGSVGGSGEQRGGGSGKGYSALPAEAKIACDKFIKQGLVTTREAYARDYFGE